MPLLTDEWPSKRRLSAIGTLVFRYTVAFLFLTCGCRGQSQMVGPSQPIVVTLGEDIMLPCHLEPAVDITDMTIEWTRPDLNPRFIHVMRDGVELEKKKHPSYVNRTSVSINKLRHGDISLNLSKVKLSDKGKYRCFIPTLHRDSTVELVVGAVSSLTISLMRTDDDKDLRGVDLQCESAGWYPEPEVLWLDGEGNLVSAGPPETVRGPDDLYTVSSRVTVEKRHGNSFTCRVQQRIINQTTETTVHLPGDFLNAACRPAAPVTISLAVVFMVIPLVVFIVWKWRRKQRRQSVGTGNFTTPSKNNTEIPLLIREKRKTLPIMLENMDIKGLDETKAKLDAELKAVEEERKDVVGAVHLLMDQKKDLENREHDLRLELQELEKNRVENQCQLLSPQRKSEQINEHDTERSAEKQNENQILETKAKLDGVKKELESKIRTTDTFLKSTLCGINIMTQRKTMLDDDKEQINQQLEEIEKQRDEIQKRLRSEHSET